MNGWWYRCIFECDLNELTLSAALTNAESLFHKEGAEAENLLEDTLMLELSADHGWKNEASVMVYTVADSTQVNLVFRDDIPWHPSHDIEFNATPDEKRVNLF